MPGFSYQDYIRDSSIMDYYYDYQKRYAERPRESDKVIIEIVHSLLDQRDKTKEQPKILDIGCSTGNLLRHLKRVFPDAALTGGDIVPKVLDNCRKDSALTGVSFTEMSILDLGMGLSFDIVIANATLAMIGFDEFEKAIESVASALKPGGWLIAFDWFHPFDQRLEIFEFSRLHPKGMPLCFRPYSDVTEALTKSRFEQIRFQPFQIPIDLPKPDDPSSVGTYTMKTEHGERLNFRGTLFQPWCHLVAQKTA